MDWMDWVRNEIEVRMVSKYLNGREFTYKL